MTQRKVADEQDTHDYSHKHHLKKSSLCRTDPKTLLSSGKKPLTDFQLKVLTALCEVPTGKATTYKILAKHIHCGSNQAVGQALRRNPYSPAVPCHRVVSQTGAMHGFGGQRTGAKIEAKLALLRKEGVLILEDGTVDPSCIYRFQND